MADVFATVPESRENDAVGRLAPNFDPSRGSGLFEGALDQTGNSIYSGARAGFGMAAAGVMEFGKQFGSESVSNAAAEYQDDIFEQVVDPAIARRQRTDENAQMYGMTSNILSSVSTLVGENVLAPVIEGSTRTGQELQKGKELGTAATLGGIEAGITAATVFLPFTLPAKGTFKYLVKGLYGVGSSLGVGEAGRQAEIAALEKAGYVDEANRIREGANKARVVETIIGLFFGSAAAGWSRYADVQFGKMTLDDVSDYKPPPPTKLVDAAMTETVKMVDQASNPFLPEYQKLVDDLTVILPEPVKPVATDKQVMEGVRKALDEAITATKADEAATKAKAIEQAAADKKRKADAGLIAEVIEKRLEAVKGIKESERPAEISEMLAEIKKLLPDVSKNKSEAGEKITKLLADVRKQTKELASAEKGDKVKRDKWQKMIDEVADQIEPFVGPHKPPEPDVVRERIDLAEELHTRVMDDAVAAVDNGEDALASVERALKEAGEEVGPLPEMVPEVKNQFDDNMEAAIEAHNDAIGNSEGAISKADLAPPKPDVEPLIAKPVEPPKAKPEPVKSEGKASEPKKPTVEEGFKPMDQNGKEMEVSVNQLMAIAKELESNGVKFTDDAGKEISAAQMIKQAADFFSNAEQAESVLSSVAACVIGAING